MKEPLKTPELFRTINFFFRIGLKKRAYKFYKNLPDQDKKHLYADAFNNWPDNQKHARRLGKLLDLF